MAEDPELLSLELEHVIEQMEGLDLNRLARGGDAMVVASPEGTFETARAIAAGRATAIEFYAEGDPALTGAARGVSWVWRTLQSRADRRAQDTRIRALFS